MSTTTPLPAPREFGDALFVFAADDVRHPHIGSCAVFAGPAPSLVALTQWVCAALDRAERYRQLARILPGDLGRPLWIDAPDFLPTDHVRSVSPPAPGDDQALQALMTDLMAGELAPTRPLWDMWLVNGLSGGRWAIVSKVHPCMVGSAGGLDLLGGLLGTTSDVWQFRRILKPWTPQQHAQPRWAFGRCRLEDLRAISAASDISVDDVIVAAVAAARRDLLILHGEDPDIAWFSAVVPSRTTLTELPVSVADPVARLGWGRAEESRVRHSRPRGAAAAPSGAFDVLPASLFTWALNTGTPAPRRAPHRAVNTVIAHIAGPSEPLHALGREMIEYLPFVPIGTGPRLGVAVITSNAGCTFGVTGDEASADDVTFLAGRLEAAVQELLRCARPTSHGERTDAGQ